MIYKIENLKNGKVYIGSTKNLPNSWNCHLYTLLNNMHTNKDIQKDYNTDGMSVFDFRVIKENVASDRLLVEKQLFINEFSLTHTMYNQRSAFELNKNNRADERRFIDYINNNWLVPIGCSSKDAEKYRIYREEDKEQIIDIAHDCKLFNLPRSALTFNRVVHMLESALGYEIESGRFTMNLKNIHIN